MVLKQGLLVKLYSYDVYEAAVEMVNIRNELSHVYHQQRFEDLRQRILELKHIFDELARPLLSVNEQHLTNDTPPL